MDDAAYGLPGTSFWKGYETVARACLRLPDLGFDNVLNVGHNRVFERRA
jgi:alpha-D-ribose 1-methylphosphonate 5-triphosphate synthase subunit PhnG